MSEVIRLSDEMLEDLKIFNNLYLGQLKKDADRSALCKTLYNDHLNYSLNNQVGFAIRYAANNLRLDINRQFYENESLFQ